MPPEPGFLDRKNSKPAMVSKGNAALAKAPKSGFGFSWLLEASRGSLNEKKVVQHWWEHWKTSHVHHLAEIENTWTREVLATPNAEGHHSKRNTVSLVTSPAYARYVSFTPKHELKGSLF